MSLHSLSPKSSNESLPSRSSSTVSWPDKLAPAVHGAMVWEGGELDPSDYVLQLSEREIQDIRAAVIKVKSKKKSHRTRQAVMVTMAANS